MKIQIFTIRDKKTKELIFAEGAQHDEYYSSFKLEKQWLNQNEINATWHESTKWMTNEVLYSFDEEVRHLINRKFEKIVFSLEKIEFN